MEHVFANFTSPKSRIVLLQLQENLRRVTVWQNFTSQNAH